MKKQKKKDTQLDVIARGVANIQSIMATKEDLKLMATKEDLRAMETRIVNKIDAVQESVDALDEIQVSNLQDRMAVAEKDIRTLNRSVFKTT